MTLTTVYLQAVHGTFVDLSLDFVLMPCTALQEDSPGKQDAQQQHQPTSVPPTSDEQVLVHAVQAVQPQNNVDPGEQCGDHVGVKSGEAPAHQLIKPEAAIIQHESDGEAVQHETIENEGTGQQETQSEPPQVPDNDSQGRDASLSRHEAQKLPCEQR